MPNTEIDQLLHDADRKVMGAEMARRMGDRPSAARMDRDAVGLYRQALSADVHMVDPAWKETGNRDVPWLNAHGLRPDRGVVYWGALMRTLSEIIDAAKVGGETTHEELLYALLAYSALHYFDNHAIARLAEKKDSKFITPEQEHEESFRRFKAALGKSPKEYVGWNNDPKNPEHVRFVNMGRKLVDKMAGGS